MHSLILETTYPSKIAWDVPIRSKQSADEFFSFKTAKKIRSALNRLQENDYQFIFEKPTEQLINYFEPLYIANINTKTNGNLHSVTAKLANSPCIQTYWMLNLYHKAEYIGGFIFRGFLKQNTTKTISTIFKVFPKKLAVNLPISCTYVAEYLLYQFALEYGYQKFTHGLDRNMFGYYTDIGLAMFKLQIGALPYCSKKCPESYQQFIWHADKDVLLFTHDKHSEYCQHAYLLLAETTEEAAQVKYGAILHSQKIQVTLKSKADLLTRGEDLIYT